MQHRRYNKSQSYSEGSDYMARRWTPRRLIVMRRTRILACILSLSLAASCMFAFTAQKSIALVVNGKTRVVNTYATTSARLLEEQHIPVKTHDQVISSSGDILTNHATVTVRLSLIHISEPTRLGMISYAVFCLKKKRDY